MIGKTIGSYRIIAELGSGGMGQVYKAEVTEASVGLAFGKEVAVKIVHSELFAQHGVFKRFLREAEAGKLVRQENVVRTYDVDAIEVDGKMVHYLVVEYVAGQTLHALRLEVGRVPEELCRHVGREAAKGLAAIHDVGIVHRDIKPENVLITPDHVIKIMDLGVAHLVEEEIRHSLTSGFVGSVLYGAPEQLCDASLVDGRADLFALGLTLYELVAGVHPFANSEAGYSIGSQIHQDAPLVRELNPQVSLFFEELLSCLLRREPDDRLPSAATLLEILEHGEQSDWWIKREASTRARNKRARCRVRVPRQTALYGREDELALLHSLYERAEAGNGQILLIEGEPGIGKTRLMDDFVAELESADNEKFNFLFGTFPPGGAATESRAYHEAFFDFFRADHVESEHHEHLASTPGLASAFTGLLGGDATSAGTNAHNKDALHAALAQTTRALAATRPTLVLIDDLHFTCQAGLATFASLALAVQGHSAMLVGTTRLGLPRDWVVDLCRLPHASRFQLQRIGNDALAGLIGDALGSGSMARQIVDEVAAKSDGNPLYALEIIRSLHDTQSLRKRPGHNWKPCGSIGADRIPSTVADLIRVRVLELREQDKDILNVAACCGFEFDPALVAEVLGDNRIAILKRLAALEQQHRLVRSVGLRFCFDHSQLRAVLYGDLPGMLRQEYHSAIANTLEAQTKIDARGNDGASAAQICRHFLEGALDARAFKYLESALDHLEGQYQDAAAVQLMDLALSAPGLLVGSARLAMLLRKARLLEFLGRHEAERSALSEALALSDAINEDALGFQVRYALGDYNARVSDYSEATMHLEQALELACANADSEGEALATDTLGYVLGQLGRWDEARKLHICALELHRKNKNQRGELDASNHLESVFGNLGWLDESLAHHMLSLEIAQAGGFRRGEARTRTLMGFAYARLGQHEDARQHHEAAIRIARQIGYVSGEALALHGLASVCEETANVEDATQNYEDALAYRRTIGDRHGVANTLVALGRHLAATEQQEAATECLEEALELGRVLNAPSPTVLSAAHLALLPSGDVKVAVDALEEYGSLLVYGARMVACFLLWQATGDRAYLDQAHTRLLAQRDRAPEDYRVAMMNEVPTNRAIAAAWEAAGAESTLLAVSDPRSVSEC